MAVKAIGYAEKFELFFEKKNNIKQVVKSL